MESNVQIGNLSFVYNKPEKENGVITNQEIEYSYKPYYVCAEDSEYEHNVTKTNTTGIIDNGDKFNASLENLQPFWRYTIRVRVSTYAGFSNYSQPTTIQTLPTSKLNRYAWRRDSLFILNYLFIGLTLLLSTMD